MLCMLSPFYLQSPALYCIVIVAFIKVHEQHLCKVETVFPGAIDGIVFGSIEHSTQQEVLLRPALIHSENSKCPESAV